MHHCHHNLQSDQIDKLVFLDYQNKCFSADICCHSEISFWLLLDPFLKQRLWFFYFILFFFARLLQHFPLAVCPSLPSSITCWSEWMLCWTRRPSGLYICIYLSMLSCLTGLFFMPPLWPIKVTLLPVWVAGCIKIGTGCGCQMEDVLKFVN